MKCINCGNKLKMINKKVKIVIGYSCLICGDIYHTYDEAEECELKHRKDALVEEGELPEEAIKGLTSALEDVKHGRYEVITNDPKSEQDAPSDNDEIKKEIDKDYV